MDRRTFVKSSALSLSSLAVGFSVIENKAIAVAPDKADFSNPWIRIYKDNSVTMVTSRSEMGQDAFTALPLIIAEELDYPIDKIKVELAPFDPKHHGNPVFGGAQVTGWSGSIRGSYDIMREIGASARQLFLNAAAKKWGVPVISCTTNNGTVICGSKSATYGELAELASKEIVSGKPKLKDPSRFKYIGNKNVKRLDSSTKSDGTAVFGIDVNLPDLMIAVIKRCPVVDPNTWGTSPTGPFSAGKIKSYDASEALKIPGVVGAYQIDEGIAIVASNYYTANKAKKLVKIDWEIGDTSSLKDNAAYQARLRAASGKSGVVAKKAGNFENPLEGAVNVISSEYDSPFLNHANLETLNCSVSIENGECHVYGPFQVPESAHALAARISGLSAEKVFVHSTFIGGGLGRKTEWDFVRESVLIAKLSGKKIKNIWSREDDLQHGMYRAATYHQCKAGFDAKGKLTGINIKLIGPSCSTRAVPDFIVGGIDLFMNEGLGNNMYEVPNMRYEVLIQDLDVRVGYMRSVGNQANTFAIESFIDELAQAASRDPVDLRRELLAKHPRGLSVLDLVTRKANWYKKQTEGRYLGLSVGEFYGSYLALIAEISVKNDKPVVHKFTCAIDPGIAVRPDQVIAQTEGCILHGYWNSMSNKITFKDGVVQDESFDSYKMLRFEDVPVVEVHIISNPHAKPSGVGEAGVSLPGAAIANAFAKATGKRIRSLPLLDA